MTRVFAGLVVALFSSGALAGPLHVRLSSGPTYSRIVVDDRGGAPLSITHRFDRLSIASGSSSGLATSTGHAALVLHSSVRQGEVVLDLSPNSSIRQFRRGSTRTIDVFASVASPAKAVPAATGDRSRGWSTQELVPGLPDAFGARIENERPVSKGAQPSLVSASARSDHSGASPKSEASKATAVRQPSDGSPAISAPMEAIAAAPVSSSGLSDAILLPFSADVGVAAVRHAHDIRIYFDEARPIDLSAFQSDPVFGGASVTMQTDATALTLPLRPGQSIAMSRQSAGWRLAVGKAPDLTPIHMQPAGNELHFLVPAPGRVFTAVDPVTGALLMVGTDREARNAFLPAYRSATFIAKRSELGLVIEPMSDRLSLRPIKDGFSLYRDDGGSLAVPHQHSASSSLASASGLTRLLDLPAGSTPILIERLDQRLLAAAQAAPRARLSPRLAAAETMIALGMAREARTLLRVAFADDPTAASDPRALMLLGLADFLTDPDQVASINDPRLPPSDEIRLWRALASRPGPISFESNASILRSTLPLILSYPANLRDMAAALAASVLVAGGSPADLAALDRLPSTPGTAVAKSVAMGMRGNATSALSRLDGLATDRDLKVSSDAILDAVLLRVRLGRVSASAAADALAAHRLDWRATGQEGEVLMREADLRRQAGQWLKAFDLWREIERRFPGLAEQAQSDIVAVLGRLSEPGVAAGMSPADFVLIVSNCAPELVSREAVAAKLAPILADRLEALDLPTRATGVLRQVMDATSPGVARAELGAKLASLLLDQDDFQGAQTALDQSDAAVLPAEVTRSRNFVLAQVLERQGHHDLALAAIGSDESEAAQNAKATILADAGRWHEAKIVLETLSKSFPRQGLLARGQADQAIRLATAASHDGDTTLLIRLAQIVDGRFPDPDQQQTFGLMTAPLTQQVPPPATPSAG